MRGFNLVRVGHKCLTLTYFGFYGVLRMRHRSQPFFRYEPASVYAHTVGFVLDTNGRILQLVYELLHACSQVHQIFFL